MNFATGATDKYGIGWHNWVLEQAAANPDAPAMVGPEESLTFKQLAWRASKYAQAFMKSGVKPGHIVVVRMPREYDAIANIALSMIGAVSASNTAKQFFDFEPITDWLITRKEVENYPATKQIIISPLWIQRAFNDLEVTPLFGFQNDESLARLVFTSGTTGRPKAVPLTWKQLEIRTKQGLSKLSIAGAVLAIYDLGSAAGFLRLTADMFRGAPYLTLGTRDVRGVVELSKMVSIEGLHGSPAQIQGFLDEFLTRPFDFTHLKNVRSGGASVPGELQRFVEQRFGFPLEVGYGSTEAGYISSRIKNADVDTRDVGESYEGVEIEVVDDQHQTVEPGVVGLVRVKTPDIVQGYFRNPEATAKAFKDGWFYPGDTGYIAPNGNLVVGGRVSELINLGGNKFDPSILDDLAAQVSGLNAPTQIAAFSFQDEHGQVKLGFAYLSDLKIDKRAIEKAIAKKHRIPAVAFLPIPIMPTNESGKMMRSSITEIFSRKSQ